jgi:hypothetical protein
MRRKKRPRDFGNLTSIIFYHSLVLGFYLFSFHFAGIGFPPRTFEPAFICSFEGCPYFVCYQLVLHPVLSIQMQHGNVVLVLIKPICVAVVGDVYLIQRVGQAFAHFK